MREVFGEKLPPIVIDFKTSTGSLIINDPQMVEELYVTKNKYFDKYWRPKNLLQNVAGDSIIFNKTNDLWF